MLRFTCILILLCLATQPASAQSGYNKWAPPGSGDTTGDSEVQSFIDRLNKLVDEAEKAKAADPRFLQDLRDLANRRVRPSTSQILSDSFSDGDYTKSPAWSVRSGKYWIEQHWGLRSSGDSQSGTQQQSNQKMEGADAAVALLGVLLGAAGGEQNNGNQPATTTTVPAVITTTAAISNAFSLTLEISSWGASGQFSVGPYQGQNPDNGYRLVYSPGEPLELQRLSARRGIAVIDRGRRTVSIEDQKAHRIEWTRQTNGEMQVLLDGKRVLKVTDVGFRDDFGGLVVSNAGSDVILRSVELLSVR